MTDQLYEGRGRAPSVGSVRSTYSHASRSSHASRISLSSRRSIASRRRETVWEKIKKPIFKDMIFKERVPLSYACMATAFYTSLMSLFTIATAIFDLYCLAEAVPGSVHYGYYIFSFEFVYVGNKHVRNSLIVLALFSFLLAIALLITSGILVMALKEEKESRFRPWMYVMLPFTLWRIFAFIFWSVVNDMIYGYHISMCLIWLIFSVLNVTGFLLIYSLYRGLQNVSKLEHDLQSKSRSYAASLPPTMTPDIHSSRPTTPGNLSGYNNYY